MKNSAPSGYSGSYVGSQLPSELQIPSNTSISSFEFSLPYTWRYVMLWLIADDSLERRLGKSISCASTNCWRLHRSSAVGTDLRGDRRIKVCQKKFSQKRAVPCSELKSFYPEKMQWQPESQIHFCTTGAIRLIVWNNVILIIWIKQYLYFFIHVKYQCILEKYLVVIIQDKILNNSYNTYNICIIRIFWYFILYNNNLSYMYVL